MSPPGLPHSSPSCDQYVWSLGKKPRTDTIWTIYHTRYVYGFVALCVCVDSLSVPGFVKFIGPSSSGLLHWIWNNRTIPPSYYPQLTEAFEMTSFTHTLLDWHSWALFSHQALFYEEGLHMIRAGICGNISCFFCGIWLFVLQRRSSLIAFELGYVWVILSCDFMWM